VPYHLIDPAECCQQEDLSVVASLGNDANVLYRDHRLPPKDPPHLNRMNTAPADRQRLNEMLYWPAFQPPHAAVTA